MASWGYLLKSASTLASKGVSGLKVAWPVIKNVTTEAAKTVATGVKATAPHVKSAVKEGVNVTKGTIEFASKNKTVVGVGGLVGAVSVYNKSGGEGGALGFVQTVVGGEKAKEGGAVGLVSNFLLGESKDAEGNEKSLIAKTGEALIGKNSYAGLKESVGEGYNSLRNGVGSVVDGVGNLYQDGRQMVGNLFQGNGMVANEQGYYSDPTSSAYPGMNQMMGQMSGNGLMGGLMGGMNNAVNAISGGNVSKMNIASLLLSAYMMFGRFGWLGKAASLMLGGMTLNNINNRQQPVYHQQQGYQQSQGMGQLVQATTRQMPSPAQIPVEEDDDVVFRSRGV